MFDTPAKQAKEHIARAKGALSKADPIKAMQSGYEAVKLLKSGKIYGRERFEVDVLMNEFVVEYNRHPDIRAHFTARNIHATPYCKYERGKEKALMDFFDQTIKAFRHEEEQSDQEQAEKHEQTKFKWLEHAQKLLDSGDTAKAKVYLRRVADNYGGEPGVLTDVGARMLGAGLYFEAGEALEEAFDMNQKDSKALAYAVKAYKNAREYTKMEQLYKKALKVFGAHPKTLLNMAKMYLDWHKWDEAYNHAKQAYDGDNSLEEAKQIMETTGKRIFTRGSFSGPMNF
jgi:tetratricopeptide (TPR) repeat protein